MNVDPNPFRGFLPNVFSILNVVGEAGNDHVSGLAEVGINPQPELPSPDLAPTVTTVVNVTGGRGNDILDGMARVAFNPQPEPPASVYLPNLSTEVNIAGGRGNDIINGMFDLDDLIGQLAVDVHGGRGNDVIRIDAHGQVSSDAVFRISGGRGNDHVRGNFDVAVLGDAFMQVEVLGSRGRDNLGLAIRGVDDRDRLFALLDGGRGFDVGFATTNVTVKNIERLWRLR